jgi:hypothetical protein
MVLEGKKDIILHMIIIAIKVHEDQKVTKDVLVIPDQLDQLEKQGMVD